MPLEGPYSWVSHLELALALHLDTVFREEFRRQLQWNVYEKPDLENQDAALNSR